MHAESQSQAIEGNGVNGASGETLVVVATQRVWGDTGFVDGSGLPPFVTYLQLPHLIWC